MALKPLQGQLMCAWKVLQTFILMTSFFYSVSPDFFFMLALHISEILLLSVDVFSIGCVYNMFKVQFLFSGFSVQPLVNKRKTSTPSLCP